VTIWGEECTTEEITSFAVTSRIIPHFLVAACGFVYKKLIPWLCNTPTGRRPNTVFDACHRFDVPLICSHSHSCSAQTLIIVPHLLLAACGSVSKKLIPRLCNTPTGQRSDTVLDACLSIVFEVPLTCSRICNAHTLLEIPVEMSLAAFAKRLR